MLGESLGARFLAAFNDIEDQVRNELHAGLHVEFATLARQFAARKHLLRPQLEALLAYATLRNAISHGRYYDGRPIAEPVEKVVEQIERLREQIKAPPVALTVLGQMTVRTVSPTDPIGAALHLVRAYDYSQLPVYRDHQYLGLLTTNAIARWLANQLTTNGGLAQTETVEQVLGFAEPHEKALLVPRSLTVTDAIYQLAHGGEADKPVAALIIAQTGKPHETPLAMIVVDDLPALTSAVTLP